MTTALLLLLMRPLPPLSTRLLPLLYLMSGDSLILSMGFSDKEFKCSTPIILFELGALLLDGLLSEAAVYGGSNTATGGDSGVEVDTRGELARTLTYRVYLVRQQRFFYSKFTCLLWFH